MDKELIDHIKDKLQLHEEAYIPGAWERFSAQEEKKRRGFIYWPLWSAAAIILVVGCILFLQNNHNAKIETVVKTTKPQIKQQESIGEEKSSQSGIANNKSATPVHLNTTNLSTSKPNHNIQTDILTFKTEHEVQVANNLSKVTTPELSLLNANALENQSKLSGIIHSYRIAANAAHTKMQIIPEKQKTPTTKLSFEQLLERDSYDNNLAKTEKKKSSAKWEPGVFVAPVMGNDNKVNMNYGFSLSYNLANKLSISSGIAYAALSTTSNPSANNNSFNDAAANVSSKGVAYSSASKSLESINASVSGINIPIELKYSISSKFYTGVGISALAVFNNKQDNNYLVTSAQNTTVANSMGYTEQKMLIVTEKISEPQAESSTASDKYIGFYNFSIGYKQKVSKKNNFAVEPFLRLPMKTFSKDNLNLMNGGLRLKFEF